jgi:hypothetical protein
VVFSSGFSRDDECDHQVRIETHCRRLFSDLAGFLMMESDHLPRQARDKKHTREKTETTRPIFASQEIHIAPDVSLFIKQYYQLTQNRTELAELYPLLEGVADFLVSRVNRTDDQGWLSIETIVGADEVRHDPVTPHSQFSM